MSTTFIDVTLTDVIAHPKNPRQKATADPELVESVKASGLIQPLVIAPHTTQQGKYVLIAGHRRVAACKKAGKKTAPAILRTDLHTEVLQVEAMLIENGRRLDLTPIEEAEGYHQLELLGVKQTAIATAVGRDVKTVRNRLKLLKLAPTTRKKVHAGQLSIDDAATFIAFADDPDATKKLEKAANSALSWEWKDTVARLKRQKKEAALRATRVAELLDAGATDLSSQIPDGTTTWQLRQGDVPELVARSLHYTHSTEIADHNGCLAFAEAPTYTGGELELVELCTHPTGHDSERVEQQTEDEAKIAAERAARVEQEKAEQAAGDVRVATLVDAGWPAMPPEVTDTVRALLPILLAKLNISQLETYQDALDLPDNDRWTALGYATLGRPNGNLTRFNSHCEDLAIAAPAKLTRHLVASLSAFAEDNLTERYEGLRHRYSAVAYLDLLDAFGHERSPIDDALVAHINGDDAEDGAA